MRRDARGSIRAFSFRGFGGMRGCNGFDANDEAAGGNVKRPSVIEGRLWSAGALGLVLAFSAGSAHAGSGGAKGAQAAKGASPAAAASAGSAAKSGKSAKVAPVSLAAVTAQLAAPATLAEGLAAAQAAGAGARTLAPRIEELLAKGLPAKLAIAAISALGAIGLPTSSAVIGPYVQHRDAEIRKAAATALASTRGHDAALALQRGLRSNDAVVRSLSAVGLGSAGDKDSVPDLVKAFDKGVAEAGPPIAALCEGAQCDELVSRFSKLSADARRAALETVLKRKPPLPDAVLVTLVQKTQAGDKQLPKLYFQTLRFFFKGSPKVKRALGEAAEAAPAKGSAP